VDENGSSENVVDASEVDEGVGVVVQSNTSVVVPDVTHITDVSSSSGGNSVRLSERVEVRALAGWVGGQISKLVDVEATSSSEAVKLGENQSGGGRGILLEVNRATEGSSTSPERGVSNRGNSVHRPCSGDVTAGSSVSSHVSNTDDAVSTTGTSVSVGNWTTIVGLLVVDRSSADDGFSSAQGKEVQCLALENNASRSNVEVSVVTIVSECAVGFRATVRLGLRVVVTSGSCSSGIGDITIVVDVDRVRSVSRSTSKIDGQTSQGDSQVHASDSTLEGGPTDSQVGLIGGGVEVAISVLNS